jgi:hypothetical membrane protein
LWSSLSASFDLATAIRRNSSELGEAVTPNAIIMNTAGLLLLGILLIAFALGLHRGINKGKGSKTGPALIVYLL